MTFRKKLNQLFKNEKPEIRYACKVWSDYLYSAYFKEADITVYYEREVGFFSYYFKVRHVAKGYPVSKMYSFDLNVDPPVEFSWPEAVHSTIMRVTREQDETDRKRYAKRQNQKFESALEILNANGSGPGSNGKSKL